MGNKNKQFRFMDKFNLILNKLLKKRIHFSYNIRLFIVLGLFLLGVLSCYGCFKQSIHVEERKITNYTESGSSNYKVYLKPNDFYDTDYLDGNTSSTYVASIIKNVSIDFNYKFDIDTPIDYNVNYDVIGKLTIYNADGTSVMFEKEYELLKNKELKAKDKNGFEIKENIPIDYTYYNTLASNFKITYGLESQSNLTVFIRFNKEIKNYNINPTSQMSVKIPLSERAIQIKIDDSSINYSNSIIKDTSISLTNVLFVVLGIISLILTIAFLLELLELLMILVPQPSEYDKALKKILREYDRLIVETSTFVDFSDKNVIKLRKFSELLDARDNLKLPIMYHDVIKHHKSNFYIKQNKTIYLYVMKSSDLELNKNNK